MPLGKEWTLNHWIYRAATSCHREISAFEQATHSSKPQSVCSPSHPDRRAMMSHSVPLYHSLTQQRWDVDSFKNENRHGAARSTSK